METALLMLALLGHAFLWVGLANRFHGTAWPTPVMHGLLLLCMGCLVAIPAAYLIFLPSAGLVWRGSGAWLPAGSGMPYLIVCWVSAVANLSVWTWRHVLHRPPEVLLRNEVRRTRLPDPPSEKTDSPDWRHHRLVYLPRNQILDMELCQRHLEVDHLDPALDGLSIVHLSDIHFTGRVGKAFFDQVVQWTNQFDPDLVVFTGDLIDNTDCIRWIGSTLGRLRSKWGVYFILGNHDWRLALEPIHRAMLDAGLISLSGRWLEVPVRDRTVLLAGNELPWIVPAADLAGAPPPAGEGGPLRVLLSHSPDQLPWARHHHFDLMLAGHTHGGQICFPLIGPVLTPSRVGVRYASGVFHEPPTILHVTRGVSGELPLRWLCPPEIDKLVLHSPRRPATV